MKGVLLKLCKCCFGDSNSGASQASPPADAHAKPRGWSPTSILREVDRRDRVREEAKARTESEAAENVRLRVLPGGGCHGLGGYAPYSAGVPAKPPVFHGSDVTPDPPAQPDERATPSKLLNVHIDHGEPLSLEPIISGASQHDQASDKNALRRTARAPGPDAFDRSEHLERTAVPQAPNDQADQQPANDRDQQSPIRASGSHITNAEPVLEHRESFVTQRPHGGATVQPVESPEEQKRRKRMSYHYDVDSPYNTGYDVASVASAMRAAFRGTRDEPLLMEPKDVDATDVLRQDIVSDQLSRRRSAVIASSSSDSASGSATPVRRAASMKAPSVQALESTNQPRRANSTISRRPERPPRGDSSLGPYENADAWSQSVTASFRSGSRNKNFERMPSIGEMLAEAEKPPSDHRSTRRAGINSEPPRHPKSESQDPVAGPSRSPRPSQSMDLRPESPDMLPGHPTVAESYFESLDSQPQQQEIASGSSPHRFVRPPPAMPPLPAVQEDASADEEHYRCKTAQELLRDHFGMEYDHSLNANVPLLELTKSAEATRPVGRKKAKSKLQRCAPNEY